MSYKTISPNFVQNGSVVAENDHADMWKDEWKWQTDDMFFIWIYANTQKKNVLQNST